VGFAYEKAGDGLLLIGYADGARKLSSRLLRNRDVDFNVKLKGIANPVIHILKKDSKDNTIVMNWIHLSRNSEYAIAPGMIPLFWWPIDRVLLRKIVFREALVLTAFNPAFLMSKLRSLNLSVEWEKSTGNLRVSTQLKDGRSVEVRGMPYFIMLIQRYLLDENAVVEAIRQALVRLQEADIKGNAKIDFNINTFL